MGDGLSDVHSKIQVYSEIKALHFTALSTDPLGEWPLQEGSGFVRVMRWVWKPSSRAAFYSLHVTGIYYHLLTMRNIKQFSTFPLNEWDSAEKS